MSADANISVSAFLPALEDIPANSIAKRYSSLDRARGEVLERGREAAKLTIPSVLPPDGATENTKLATPFQAVGARTTNNLSNKLLLTLFPPFIELVVGLIDRCKINAGTG